MDGSNWITRSPVAPSMDIVDLSADASVQVTATAKLLQAGFRTFAPEAWPTLADAMEEVGRLFRGRSHQPHFGG